MIKLVLIYYAINLYIAYCNRPMYCKCLNERVFCCWLVSVKKCASASVWNLDRCIQSCKGAKKINNLKVCGKPKNTQQLLNLLPHRKDGRIQQRQYKQASYCIARIGLAFKLRKWLLEKQHVLLCWPCQQTWFDDSPIHVRICVSQRKTECLLNA